MPTNDKLKLLKNYKNRTGRSDKAEQVEIGKPKAEASRFNNAFDTSLSTVEVSGKHEFIRDSGYIEPKEVDREVVSFSPVFNADISMNLGIDDSVFRPMAFTQNFTVAENNTKELYEEIKNAIVNIDCAGGLEMSYRQFDNLLQRLSDCDSGELTNSQLLILISSMITKLEELNSYNYPEIDLKLVQSKLEVDGNKAVYNNTMDAYFFEEFYRYYQNVELDQFNNLKDRYINNIRQFSEFQQKKGAMLMCLLKWLMS